MCFLSNLFWHCARVKIMWIKYNRHEMGPFSLVGTEMNIFVIRICRRSVSDSDHTYQDWWLEMEIKWQRIYLSKISWFHQDIDSTKIQVFTFYPDKRRIHDSIQFGKVGLDPKDWQNNWESSSLNMFNILFNFKFTFSHRK